MGKDTATVFTEIIDRSLDEAALRGRVADERCGALVCFTGMIRNHDDGRSVQGLVYEAHHTAESVLHQIAQEQACKEQIHRVLAVHRIGRVELGQTAMFVAVSAEHRREAFLAASEIVDQIKVRLPVWKQQIFSDGTHEWVGLK